MSESEPDAVHELPTDAPPVPTEPPADTGQEAADAELQQLRQEVAELRAAREATDAQQARTEALSAASARHPVVTPAVFAALGDRVSTEDIPAVAEALHKAIAAGVAAIARPSGVGKGGLQPDSDGATRASWSNFFNSKR